ncbi:MAG: CDP-alcohol phosphatidyltransferase family protein [Acidimicrobiia bacterium]|nr:CDP-alcohol phosphatidyltransferase family protein [Acidimicrobiia bacterium]
MTVLNLPNLVSLVRIGLVPLFLYLVFGPEEFVWAGLLLGVIGSTDWVDGQLARRLDQVTELGKLLDPLADRLAIVAAVIGGWIAGILPPWFAAALVVREVVIGLGALVVAVRVRAKLDVRWLGKAATLALYTSIAFFYIRAGAEAAIWDAIAWGFGIPGLVLYYVVAGQYLGDAAGLLRRSGRVTSGPTREQGGVG